MKKLTMMLLTTAFIGQSLSAQDQAPEEDSKAGDKTQLSTSTGDNVPKTEIPFAFYSDEKGNYIAPIMQIAGGVTTWDAAKTKATERDEQELITTAAITRFGLRGQVSKYISFHSEFERNLGVKSTLEVAGGEIIGTGVWEGSASFSARDNYVKVSRWGFSASAGIVTDPASADFFSMHISDLLLADAFSRDPLLFSGYNRAQGVLAEYNFKKLIGQDLNLGFMFNSGNPLSTSTAQSFGGNIDSLDNVFRNAFNNKTNSDLPGDKVEIRTMSPGLIYKLWIFEFRGAAQFHRVNAERTKDEDVTLFGANYRGGLAIKLFGNKIIPFGNYSETRNDTAYVGKNGNFSSASYRPGSKGEDFVTRTFSAGMDLNFGSWIGLDKRDGIGGSFAQYDQQEYKNFSNRIQYVNVGMTKWLSANASIGARYGMVVWRLNKNAQVFDKSDAKSMFFTMRLLL